MQAAAEFVGEHEAGVLPRGAGGEPFLGDTLAPLAQQPHGDVVEGDFSDGGLGLGVALVELVVHGDDLPIHGEDASSEVE